MEERHRLEWGPTPKEIGWEVTGEKPRFLGKKIYLEEYIGGEAKRLHRPVRHLVEKRRRNVVLLYIDLRLLFPFAG